MHVSFAKYPNNPAPSANTVVPCPTIIAPARYQQLDNRPLTVDDGSKAILRISSLDPSSCGDGGRVGWDGVGSVSVCVCGRGAEILIYAQIFTCPAQ